MNQYPTRFQPLRLMVLSVMVGLSLLFTVSCSSLGLNTHPNQERIDTLAKLTFPSQAKTGADLDILVVRKGKTIAFINRTPNVYRNVEIWLNEQYVNTLPKLDIGKDSQGSAVSLLGFINKYGESYPVGGLLTPDLDQKLLVAELFDPATGLRHHILVQNDD